MRTSFAFLCENLCERGLAERVGTVPLSKEAGCGTGGGADLDEGLEDGSVRQM